MPARPPRPALATRVAARVLTGPAAFLAAGVLDWMVLLSRYAYARSRGRRNDWYLQ